MKRKRKRDEGRRNKQQSRQEERDMECWVNHKEKEGTFGQEGKIHQLYTFNNAN